MENIIQAPCVLIIRNLTKTVGGRTLFSDAKMTINWGEHVVLVGPNGAGKSTLFKIVLGEEEPDEGTAEIDEYAICGSLEQEAGDPGEETILEIALGVNAEMIDALVTLRECEKSGDNSSDKYGSAQEVFEANNGYQLEPKAKKILAGLGYQPDQFDKPANTFSGGWIMRAKIARLLVMEPDLLMLDEPTNHLDLMSLIWLQRYLKNYSGAILMISHDRDFMDEIAETVYEIDNEQLISYTGNFSTYEAEKKKRFKQLTTEYRNAQKEIDRVQEFITRFRNVGSKSSQVQDRMKMVEKMKEKLVKPNPPRKVLKFQFPQPPKSNQKVVELKGVTKAYGDKVIYKDYDLTIERGDRIVLVGPNGAGKSTLMKILAGSLEIDSGTRDVGYLTKLGYYSQHRDEHLNESNTVLDEVLAANGELREEDARAILGSFLFRRTDVEKRIRVLSGGEKSRLNLVKFLVDPPNLLLLDEPTTHLDIISVDALVGALKNYEGTIVFISHDVHFIRSIAETTLHIAPGSVTRYTGGYDYFIEKSGLDDDRSAVTS